MHDLVPGSDYMRHSDTQDDFSACHVHNSNKWIHVLSINSLEFEKKMDYIEGGDTAEELIIIGIIKLGTGLSFELDSNFQHRLSLASLTYLVRYIIFPKYRILAKTAKCRIKSPPRSWWGCRKRGALDVAHGQPRELVTYIPGFDACCRQFESF